MAIRVYKPTSPARRFMSVLTFEEVTKTTPEKSLLESKKKNAGRNKQGKITVRHQGGGNKVKYRVIDFKRNKDGIPAKVAGIEYDPNRTAFIALLNYADGEKRYILAPIDLKTGDTVVSGEGADIKPGNALPIRNIPLGTLIHNIELVSGHAAASLSAAPAYAAQLMAKEGANCAGSPALRRSSHDLAWTAKATIGHGRQRSSTATCSIGKAGRTRHMGIRPTVRGVGHEPVRPPARRRRRQEPRSACPAPVTPWGKPALGLKTRKTQERTLTRRLSSVRATSNRRSS